MITLIYKGLIWYTYKGDEIAWNGRKYLSICSCGEFDTLEDLDKFWEDYFKTIGSITQRTSVADS